MLHGNLWGQRFSVVLLALTVVLTFTVVLAACGGAVPAAPAQSSAPEAPAADVAQAEAPAGDSAAVSPLAESPVEVPAEVGAEEPVVESNNAPVQESAAATGSTTFTIDPAQSEVRFTLSELLMGNPTTVIGRGNGIEGSVTVDFADYSQSSISPIVIDATTLATDNNMRNGQIRRNILQTNQPEFQFITFTPTAVEGLPESATVGEPLNLLVTGDLTIRTITQPITFEVTVTPLSENELQGSARATLLRSDFDLRIPSVSSVAEVSEDVLLEFDFIALAPQ